MKLLPSVGLSSTSQQVMKITTDHVLCITLCVWDVAVLHVWRMLTFPSASSGLSKGAYDPERGVCDLERLDWPTEAGRDGLLRIWWWEGTGTMTRLSAIMFFNLWARPQPANHLSATRCRILVSKIITVDNKASLLYVREEKNNYITHCL